jgi:hypothetical protein
MKLVYLFLFVLTVSCSLVKKQGKATNEQFFVDKSGKRVLCLSLAFTDLYYFVEYDDSNNIKRFDKVYLSNDTLYNNDKESVFAVSYRKYIRDNEFTLAKKENNNKLPVEANIKIIEQHPDIHQMTKDSVMLFKSIFCVRYERKTIINDTFNYNFITVKPASDLITTKVFGYKGRRFIFVRHVWSVEEDYDIYSKYKDYIIAL